MGPKFFLGAPGRSPRRVGGRRKPDSDHKWYKILQDSESFVVSSVGRIQQHGPSFRFSYNFREIDVDPKSRLGWVRRDTREELDLLHQQMRALLPDAEFTERTDGVIFSDFDDDDEEEPVMATVTESWKRNMSEDNKGARDTASKRARSEQATGEEKTVAETHKSHEVLTGRKNKDAREEQSSKRGGKGSPSPRKGSSGIAHNQSGRVTSVEAGHEDRSGIIALYYAGFHGTSAQRSVDYGQVQL